MSRITTVRRSFLINLLVLVCAAGLLQACGGGKKAPPPVPAITASPGYFDNVSTAGGANVYDSTNTSILLIADLQGMVNGDKFSLVSVANNLAYYATLTSLSGNNYTANVAIYWNNVLYANTTASGTLVAGMSIAGTFAATGTGFGRGTFSLDYSLANTPVAAVARIMRDGNSIPGSWGNNTPPASLSVIRIDSTGALSTQGVLSGYFMFCAVSGTITPVTNTVLYQINMTLTNCNTPTVNGNYTGLATSRTQAATDDRLVLTVTSGTSSMNGEFR